MLDAIVSYEPPTVEVGTSLNPLNPDVLAEGVRGYAFMHRGEIYIPLLEGDGDGKVGAFLDSLSHRCVVINVANPRLQAMLMRRRWECSFSDDGCSEWRRPLGR